MSDIGSLTKEVQRFQAAVKALSSDISNAGVNWHDEKQQKLSAMVADIASNSKSVMTITDRLSSKCRAFDSISSQK